MNYKDYMIINEEVQHALDNNLPVVALESTIISHGFNYPENLECARECERIIRENGAIPATIGIMGGKIVIGLNEKQIIHFAENRTTPKCSRRDVAAIIAKGIDGATTVTTTMMFAQMAGIKVFATGGIGGVHFDGENTMDISADLEELARTNVAVVCSGAKSILDIPRTLEYLETNGVTTLGYQTAAFPDFYTQDSGKKVDYRCESTDEIAKIIVTKDNLGIDSGIIIANPIPAEHALDTDFISSLIQRIVKEAADQGVIGNKVTPFILEALHRESEGKSVVANKQLVFNNSRVASLLAISYSKIQK
ncbi:pseudouridine-5'-phosphate glycosidase [Erysipelothrix sp. HDW6C]|uniref:pseudouridine-5'-phosphate glycosidase n=1 Tax=Erysipelothrix sp. HDW6C TaxID=2714930 RepID=UPI0014072F21|nr:pseudouridine-5'-phosphate glycosidase [Erysipelothrix sp. HDW6C]QIK69637.1 pseudouridine-5'-phosphate glycosidase [Erysipelothrix sp. HDW6C]